MDKACDVSMINPKLLKKYPNLREIPESEWLEWFPKMNKPWTVSEERYVRTYYGVDDNYSLAYALGRTPWSIRAKANHMGLNGISSRKQRE